MKIFGGEIKLDLNVWDITRSILAVITLIYIISFMGKAERFINTPPQQWDETTIIKIAEGVVKAQVSPNTKALEATIKALEATSLALQTIQANNEHVEELGQIVGRVEDNTVSLKGELQKFKDRPTATLDTAVVRMKDANNEEYAVATAFYSPDVTQGDKWSINTWPRTYHANVILTHDEEGRSNRYMELWTQSEWAKDPEKRQPIKITNFAWDKEKLKSKKFRFAPRVGFSGMFGTKSIVPALDYSLFSYGRTKVDMVWRFLDIGIGGNKESTLFSLTPVSYNLGESIPVISNLFIGPYIGWEIGDPTYSFGLSTSIPF